VKAKSEICMAACCKMEEGTRYLAAKEVRADLNGIVVASEWSKPSPLLDASGLTQTRS
jgi:hypothetical protein